VTSTTRPSSIPGAKISDAGISRQPIGWDMEWSSAGTLCCMGIPGVHIETVHNPIRYTYAQIEQACKVAAALGRGKLILAEPPRR
jgi:hypothetical protein